MGSPITTHVLDTARGKPAANVPVTLEKKQADGSYALVGKGVTDADGRNKELMKEGTLTKGIFRITFDTGAYLAETSTKGFFPEASIVFEIDDTAPHYHVPLLLSPYGYSTYRGS
jgi:5-hydroxyisourate hydrolase